MKVKKTVGAVSTELMQKDDSTHTAIDQMRESLVDYEKNIFEAIERAKKDLTGDFYVCVETKKERLMPNVIRNYFFYRQTCPTPTYDQTLYRFNRTEEKIEFMWVIPSKETCGFFIDNMIHIPTEQRELLKFVLDFKDGTLFTKCKQLNGEKEDSIILEKG